MSRFYTVCAAAVLVCSSTMTFASEATHIAQAEKLLDLTHANQLTLPMYSQVNQMFAMRFKESGATADKKPTLAKYQKQARAELDKAVGWTTLEPQIAKLYADKFSEEELKQIIAFYESPLGAKVIKETPALSIASAKLTQDHLQQAVPAVQKNLADMMKEITPKKK